VGRDSRILGDRPSTDILARRQPTGNAIPGVSDGGLALEPIARNVLMSVLFSMIGVGLLVGGFRALDALTPMDLERAVFEDKRVAPALLAGAFLIALALIVARSIQ
jgi:putative membrane protein